MGLSIGGGSGVLADSAVTSAKIADGAIVNADINSSAAIALTKLASAPPGHNRAPAENNLKVWVCNPAFSSSTYTITAGVVNLVEMTIRDAQTPSKIWWNVVQAYTAGGGGAANTFFGIYSLKAAGTLTLIAKTADQTATLSGAAAGPFSATATAEAGESLAFDGTKRIWGAVLVGTQGSQTLQISRMGGGNTGNNIGLTAGTDPLHSCKSGAGLSALPGTILVSGLTVDLGPWYAAS